MSDRHCNNCNMTTDEYADYIMGNPLNDDIDLDIARMEAEEAAEEEGLG